MQAKVWNKNVHPFKQKFGSDVIEIPAGGFVEMEYHDAIRFKSKAYPIETDGGNQQKPESYKMLTVEPLGDLNKENPTEVTAFKSMVDGSLHATKEALLAYEAVQAQGATADADGNKIVSTRPRAGKKESAVSL